MFESGILVDGIEEAAQLVDIVEFARQRRSQIEAESVDVHLGHPIARLVHEELKHLRVTNIERVARAGVVHVVAGSILHGSVIGMCYRFPSG